MCCQQTKRGKVTETKEKLNSCVELRADKLIKEASLMNNDPRIAALCADALIAKEAAYLLEKLCLNCMFGQQTKRGTFTETKEKFNVLN